MRDGPVVDSWYPPEWRKQVECMGACIMACRDVAGRDRGPLGGKATAAAGFGVFLGWLWRTHGRNLDGVNGAGDDPFSRNAQVGEASTRATATNPDGQPIHSGWSRWRAGPAARQSGPDDAVPFRPLSGGNSGRAATPDP
jgi:hypothetical protein